MITTRPLVLGRLAAAAGAAPRAVRIMLGVLAVAAGIALARWPFVALAAVAAGAAVLVTDLAGGVLRRRPPVVVAAVAPVVAGGVAGLFAGPVLSLLAVAGPLVLVGVGGAMAVRGADRVRAVPGGLAVAGAGALALIWPDLAEYVLAVLAGLALALAGLWLITGPRPIRVGPLPGRIGAGIALVAAVALLVMSVGALRAAPAADPPAPADVPAGPGALVSAERLTSGLGPGMLGWRIVYTTEREDGSPTVASALVVVDGDPARARPVVAWAHGTTGYAGACGPSAFPDPLVGGAAGASAVVVAALRRGAALVATDYPGLGTPGPQPYLIGKGEGRAVLDAVRAARAVPGLTLLDQVLVWGHSQGGHAALWAGAIAPDYAPDLTIAGVAGLAPATDLPAVAAGLDSASGGTILLAYALRAYADTYPDVSVGALVKPGGSVLVNALAGRCLPEPATLVSLESSARLGPLLARTVDGTAFGARLRENVPALRIAAPVLIEQGTADPLVTQASQDGFVRQLCATGTTVAYRTHAGRDHTGIVADDSPAVPELVAWSLDRLSGAPPPSSC